MGLSLGTRENRIKRLFKNIDKDQLKNHKLLLDSIAKNIVPDYKWEQDNGCIANNLINYFSGIENDYDLDKSIALCGTFGVGKTVLMRIFRDYMRHILVNGKNPNQYRIISIEDVIQYMSDQNALDSEILFNCNREVDRPMKKPVHLMINEFGYSYAGKVYGTDKAELIETFLMKRYDIFQDFGKLTHVTMNFGTAELKEAFHPRIVDRFVEMFNIIPFGGDSKRK